MPLGVLFLVFVAPIVCGVCVLSLFYGVVLCIISSFAIILLRKRELEGWKNRQNTSTRHG